MRRRTIATALAGMLLFAIGEGPRAGERPGLLPLVVAAGTEKPANEAQAKAPEARTAEEKMQRRFPQPVRVGDLIGLPLLDDADRTIGYVRSVVRTAAGKIELIVPYGGVLGWGRRPVAVPIEVVAIAGRQLAALDMTRPQFDSAPAWEASQGQPIGPDEVIRIGLYRR